MFYRVISDRILKHLSHNTDINMEYREIYSYAIEKYLSGIVNAIVFAMIALVLRIPIEAAVFFLFYIPLRRYAGGRHAKTRARCFVLSVLVMVYVIEAAVFLAEFAVWEIITIAAVFTADLLIMRFAPVDNKNKRFTPEVMCSNRKKARWIAAIETVIIIIFIIFLPLYHVYTVTAGMALLLEGILLIPNIKKEDLHYEKRSKNKQPDD